VRRSGWQRPTASRVKTPVKSGKKSLARSLSCTWVAWTLGYVSLAMESTGVRGHQRRRRLPVGCVVEARAPARSSQNLGQKKRDGVRIRSAKGIRKWLVAWWLAGDIWVVVVTTVRGKKTAKGANISGHYPHL
jgi:hypothetical protein